MKKIALLVSIALAIFLAQCKESNNDLKDTRRQLDGTWVMVGSCMDGGPTPNAWLEISGINVRSCQQNSGTYTTLKGLLVKGATEGNYRIDWENSYHQNAQYPVGVLKLLSLESQPNPTCYTQNPQYPLPSGCNQ